MASQIPHPHYYPAEPGPIGVTRDGRTIAVAAMTPEAAAILGPAIAAIDPWARVSYDPARLTGFFAALETGAPRYQIRVGDDLAGAMVVRCPWLSGPYLNILGLLPEFQGRGIGDAALGWFETEARTAKFRNIWLCVSSYNTGAQRFYVAHGFSATATLDALTLDAFDEILMRKRLI